MVRESQKLRERKFAEHFLSVAALSYSDLEDGESPDFRLTVQKRRIGMEVMELFRDTDPEEIPRQAREGGWRGVAREAHSLWTSEARPHVEVWLSFDPRHHVPRREAPQVAQQLVQIVAAQLPPDRAHISLSPIDFDYGYFPDGLYRLGISRLVDYKQSYWHVSDGDWVPQLDADQLQAALDSKAPKDPRYRESCAETWLLLVLHAVQPSQTMDVPPSVVGRPYVAPFDRVILFETLPERIHELLLVGRGDV